MDNGVGGLGRDRSLSELCISTLWCSGSKAELSNRIFRSKVKT